MIEVRLPGDDGPDEHDGETMSFTVDGGYLNIWQGTEQDADRVACYPVGSWKSVRKITQEG